MSKVIKISKNNVKENGFQSAAQARLLMMWAKDEPKYSWVWQVVKDHGIPKNEHVEEIHWSEPYNISPTTPSYTYVAKIESKLLKFAQQLDDLGFEEEADKLDQIVFVENKDPRTVANSFWATRGSEIKKNNSDSILRAFDLLEDFEQYKELESADREEAKRIIGDKILGRDNE